MNKQQINYFKQWLLDQYSEAEQSYMDAPEENVVEETYALGRRDAFGEALETLEKL